MPGPRRRGGSMRKKCDPQPSDIRKVVKEARRYLDGHFCRCAHSVVEHNAGICDDDACPCTRFRVVRLVVNERGAPRKGWGR